MKNFVSIDKNVVLDEIQKLAVTGFLFGGDNYGEEVIGVSSSLAYNEIQQGYHLTVFLRESLTHTSTAGIGFYLTHNETSLMVFSCGKVLEVGLTKEIRKILKESNTEKY